MAAIASIPQENRFYCPHTACSSLIEVKPELAARQPKQWCWECRNWMCIQCKTAWHENVSCDQNMQDPHTRQLMGMAVVEGLAQCPRCGFVVQRTEVSSSTCFALTDMQPHVLSAPGHEHDHATRLMACLQAFAYSFSIVALVLMPMLG